MVLAAGDLGGVWVPDQLWHWLGIDVTSTYFELDSADGELADDTDGRTGPRGSLTPGSRPTTTARC
ncbi:MAG: hypothetical protein R6U94_11215 [Nitriliruptoraceae bacterium]